MIDRDAIQRIVDLANGQQPIINAPDFDKTGRYYLLEEDGGYTEEFAVTPRSTARLFDTDSLARLIRAELDDENSVDVYYSADRITALILERGLYRRDAMVLERHPSFLRLQRLARTETFTQKSLIRLLRAEFNGHVSESVIERFRTLNLKTDGEGSSVVAQGRAGVDKKIQQQIRDERGEEIPSEIEVTVPVYDLDESRGDLQSVTVLVDVTPGEDGRAEFELTAVVNDLRDAERQALETILVNLKAELPDEVPVYYGTL